MWQKETGSENQTGTLQSLIVTDLYNAGMSSVSILLAEKPKEYLFLQLT